MFCNRKLNWIKLDIAVILDVFQVSLAVVAVVVVVVSGKRSAENITNML